MSEERASTYPIPDRWSYLWLAIGATLMLFSSGRWPIPLTLWLVSVFVIRFFRTQKVFLGFLLVSLATYHPADPGWSNSGCWLACPTWPTGCWSPD